MPKQVYVRGASTLSLLGIAFVVLKLCHVIDWSWIFVTMPFWIGIAIFLGVMAFIVGCALFAGLVAYLCSRK